MADVGLFDKKLSMNEKHGKRGQGISLFYLTLSDISADIVFLDIFLPPYNGFTNQEQLS
jgi:hypothetical protein